MINRAIKSVAVIGGGPAGIATVNELIHVSATGKSYLHENKKPPVPAFNRIVCFEQNSDTGGVWNFFKVPDPKLPSLETDRYNEPDEIYDFPKIPDSKTLSKTSFQHPYVKISDKIFDKEAKWNKNAAYKDLFTNVPEKFMRFSYTPYQKISKGKVLEPLVSLDDVKNYLDNLLDKYDLKRYFRLNSSVELVEKKTNKNGEEKWILTIREKAPFSKIENWYTEEFDAVVAANGHCNVPYVPKVDGFRDFVNAFPHIVQHSKSFRGAKDFENKNILLCGSGTSSADLYQYLAPIAKSVTISQRSKSVYCWIQECFDECPELKFKPRIKNYLPDGSVQFDDHSFGKYDKIVLSTGYHYHFPFLKRESEIIKMFQQENSPISKIGNLYQYTFSIKDNTFATVGIPTVGIMFHGMEYSAAAIAGVFSGIKKLPTIEEQYRWNNARTTLENPEVPHRYQGFFLEKIEEQFFNPLFSLAPLSRSNPLKIDNWTTSEVEESTPALKRAFFALKSGKYNSSDLLKQ